MVENEISIKITRQVKEEDWRRLTTWREHVFPSEGLGTEWTGGEMHILASSAGEVIGHIGFDVYNLIIDEKEAKCIGVGAVVVIPAYQGRNLPKRMFDSLREWREENHPKMALALFCPKLLVSYYKKHNFVACLKEVFYIQQGEYFKSKFEFLADRPIDAKEKIYIPSNPW